MIQIHVGEFWWWNILGLFTGNLLHVYKLCWTVDDRQDKGILFLCFSHMHESTIPPIVSHMKNG